MAVQTVAHIQATTESSDAFRRKERFLAGFAQGVCLPNSIYATPLAVTASGTPDMNVHVASGEALINGTQNLIYQGDYHLMNDAAVTLAIAAADPTNPRVDLVVVQVLDAAYSGSSSLGQIAVVTGTPAASPAVPAPPANALALAQIAVAANATSISTGNITDVRPYFANGLTLLGSLTAAGNSGTWDFQNIPQSGFTNLVLKGLVRGNAATAQDHVLQFNGDAAANYVWQQLYTNNGVMTGQNNATGTTSPAMVYTPGGNAGSGSAAPFRIEIPHYLNIGLAKQAICTTQMIYTFVAANMYLLLRGMYWTGTGALNRVTLTLVSGQDVSPSHVSLYGEP